MSLHTKKSSLEQTSSLHNQIHDINSKYLKKKMQKNPKFPQEQLINGSIETHSPAIYLNGSTRHFEHECIIKLSKKDLVLHQLNLMLNLDHSRLALFRKTQSLSRHKQGSQQGFLSTMFPYSTLTENIFISWYLIPSDQKQIGI